MAQRSPPKPRPTGLRIRSPTALRVAQDLQEDGWKLTTRGAPTYWAQRKGRLVAVYVKSGPLAQLPPRQLEFSAMLKQAGVEVLVTWARGPPLDADGQEIESMRRSFSRHSGSRKT